jgi:hypothetical protein
MPSYTNRLDALPYDCLQYILQFCSDHIQFDYKRNVIYSTPFQSKLKERYLEIEYPEDDEDNSMSEYHLYNERYLCRFLFNDYPVSSFTITRDEYDNYEIDIFYRKLGDEKRFIYKKVKPDTEENKEWNNEAVIYNEKRNKQKEEHKKKVIYTPVITHREFEFKDEEELTEDVRDRIVEDDCILNITTGIIWDNMYKKQKDKLTIGDIEALQTNEHASVLKAICDVEGVIEDVIRYDGFADFLGLRNCEYMDYRERYLCEREH